MIKIYLFLFALHSLAFANCVIPGAERLSDGDPVKQITYLSEMSCLNCHHQMDAAIPSKKGPQLNFLGSRIRKDWLVEFLKNPQSKTPGTTMPNLFEHDPKANEKIEAIVHFLLADREKTKRKLPRLNQRSHGKVLYHRLGCVACHGASPIVSDSYSNAIKPLGDLKSKYSLESLTYFLKDPLKYRPSGRMPSFQLSLDDASHISAYLLDRKEMNSHLNPNSIKNFQTNPNLVKKGKMYFENMGCANCHEKQGIKTKAKFKVWKELDFKNPGCLDGKEKVSYDLSHQQKQSLSTVDLNILRNPKQNLKHTFASLNCYACHQRDEIGGPLPQTIDHFHGEESLGDEGRLPPKLLDTGRKFKLNWIDKVLNGKGIARTTMETKMPIFGKENISHLPHLFEKLDLPKHEKGIDKLKDGQPHIGKLLIGAKGMNCIMCHNLKDRQSTGIPALNIAYSPDRYRPTWFKENLIHPNNLRPGTLMPSFWPGGKSTQMGILQGNSDLQIASIWEYLKNPQGYPEGYPPARSKFELIPSDRPIVLKTFMEGSGRHSVVVGLPNKVHYAYDSDSMQIREIWSGRFLDGYNTWYNRFAPFEKPLGDRVTSFSDHVIFSKKHFHPWPKKTPKDMGYKYQGYTLNKEGEPTFILSLGSCIIKETYLPFNQGKGMIRKISIEGQGKLWFKPNERHCDITVTPSLNYKGGVAEIDLSKGEFHLNMEYRWEK